MTKIEWTRGDDGSEGKTWNPIRGCARVSEGCRHCYAEKVAARFAGPGQPYEGTVANGRWNGSVRLVPEKLNEPLRWKKPRRVFVNSMSDLFHEDVPDEFIDRVWATMLLAPHHVFQVLTKRPERMRTYLTAPGLYDRILRAAQPIRVDRPELVSIGISNPATHPRRWIWLGVSAEDQQRADERIPLLLQTPAAVRFMSAEPLLGPVDLRHLQPGDPPTEVDALAGSHGVLRPHRGTCPRLDWVIVGGESGPGARPCEVAWIRRIVEQCRTARVACFVKQLGRRPIVPGDEDITGWSPCVQCADEVGEVGLLELRTQSSKGGDSAEWPEDLRVREWPGGDAR